MRVPVTFLVLCTCTLLLLVVLGQVDGASATSRDYYDVLGVAKDADPRAIRRAYRKMAQKYHPDKNDAPDAEQRFMEVSQAYQVLSDEEQRKLYDMHGPAYFESGGAQQQHQQQRRQGGNPFAGGFGGSGGGSRSFSYTFTSSGGSGGSGSGGGGFRDPFDLFRSMFGGMGGGGGGMGDTGGSPFGFDFGSGHRASHGRGSRQEHHDPSASNVGEPLYGNEGQRSPDGIYVLNAHQLQANVLQGHDVWLVLLHQGASHGLSRRLVEPVTKVAAAVGALLKVGTLDCSEAEARSSCTSIVNAQNPTWALWADVNVEDPSPRSASSALLYDGNVGSAKRVAAWATDHMPSRVTTVLSRRAWKDALTHASATHATRPIAVLFSSKAKVPPLWSSLSLAMHKHYTFLCVPKEAGTRDIRSELGVPRAKAAVMLLQPGFQDAQRDHRISFKGVLSAKTLRRFLSKSLAQLRPKSSGPIRGQVHQLTAASVDHLCPADAKWMCVVLVLPRGHASHDRLAQAWHELSTRYAHEPLALLQATVSPSALGLAQPLQPAARPILLAVRRAKGRYVVSDPIRNGSHLRAFVDPLTSGGASWEREPTQEWTWASDGLFQHGLDA